jgi:hypothetical protein
MKATISRVEVGVVQVPNIAGFLETGEELRPHLSSDRRLASRGGSTNHLLVQSSFFSISNTLPQNWSTIVDVLSLKIIRHLLTEFNTILII